MKCCHCGAPTYGGEYCDPCNTDSCLAVDDNGDTYCSLAWPEPDYEDEPEDLRPVNWGNGGIMERY